MWSRNASISRSKLADANSAIAADSTEAAGASTSAREDADALVEPSHAVVARDSVDDLDELVDVERHAVDRDGHAMLNRDLDDGRLRGAAYAARGSG